MSKICTGVEELIGHTPLLRLRRYEAAMHLTAAVLAKAYDGTRLTVLNQWEEWYVVKLDGMVGWASSQFITLL